MLIDILKFLLLVTSRGLQNPESGSEPEVEMVPFDPVNHVQRPLDPKGNVVMSCSLSLGEACETNIGKSLSSYCTCGKGLACRDQRCSYAEESENLPPRHGRPSRYEEMGGVGSIVQRPIDSFGREIMSCTLKLGEDCQTTVGKTWSSYCTCGEGLTCKNNKCERVNEADESENLPPGSFGESIDLGKIVQRPIDSFGREIMKCSLNKGEECESERGKTWNSYCTCGAGLICKQSSREGEEGLKRCAEVE